MIVSEILYLNGQAPNYMLVQVCTKYVKYCFCTSMLKKMEYSLVLFSGNLKKRVLISVIGLSQIYLEKRIGNIDLCMVGRGRFWQTVGKKVEKLSLFKGRKG